MTDIAAIRARREAIGNVRWEQTQPGTDCEVVAISPSEKSWTVARTFAGLNKSGVVSEFIANAPADIDRLLARVAELETENENLKSWCAYAQELIGRRNDEIERLTTD